jgi:FKBP-type peptidyl-prolyl cis-trans isomerase FklB
MIKSKLVTLGMIVALFGAVSCKKGASSSKSPENPKLESKVDSLSYALGSLIGEDLKSGGFEEFNYDVMNAAMQRALNGDSLLMDKMKASSVLQAFAMEQMKEKSGKNEKAATDFMAKNKTAAGVVTTASGLQYKIIKAGTGEKPVDGQKVKVHYTGKLLDGKVFDSSVERGEPAVFGVNEVIPGWTEGIKLMPVGSKWELYIPPALGYGAQGNQAIPGGSALIFEVELLGIEKGDAAAPAPAVK